MELPIMAFGLMKVACTEKQVYKDVHTFFNMCGSLSLQAAFLNNGDAVYYNNCNADSNVNITARLPDLYINTTKIFVF
jgi:hypothetical protein